MSLLVEKAGLQTTIQAKPRLGQRHQGVPSSGPADPLSMALANRLVGNPSLTPALETTLTGLSVRAESDCTVAATGALAECRRNGELVDQHHSIRLKQGDVMTIGSAENGVRSYLAVAGGLQGDVVLGSESTYLTAGFGGFGGRALEPGDRLRLSEHGVPAPDIQTPDRFRLAIPDSWAVRAGSSCETESIESPGNLFETKFKIASRSDRMGVKLDGATFQTDGGAQMPSVPVFPGTVQCPKDGNLYILSVDSGTTGGYPRVAKVCRMDMHMLGQLRPRSSLAFIERSDDEAGRELLEKIEYWRPWLPDVAEVI